MSKALDMSLDDVIFENRQQRGNSRGGYRGYNKNRSFGDRASPYGRPAHRPIGNSSSLVVSNLHYNVTEKDLYDLFGQIGPLNRAFLHIAPNGGSAGIADVVFKRSNDAERARNTYNNVELDGRPMRIAFAPPPNNNTFYENRYNSAPRRGGSFRGNNNRRPHGNRNDRPPVSQEDLDADMDSYMGTAPAESYKNSKEEY